MKKRKWWEKSKLSLNRKSERREEEARKRKRTEGGLEGVREEEEK